MDAYIWDLMLKKGRLKNFKVLHVLKFLVGIEFDLA